jgi:glutaredoxin
VRAEPTLIWRPGCASCAAVKEFLTVNEVAFESVNPTDPDGAVRWAALGRPRVPSLVLDGHTTALYHVSQAAALLGLATAESAQSLRLAWDIAAVLEAWSDDLAAISWQLMTTATRSRGRTVRNLTVNVHEPVRQLQVAWEHGQFVWDTDQDERRACALEDVSAVRSYAELATAEWIMFLADVGDQLGRPGHQVQAGEETLSFDALLDAQRFHAAFHYRQLRSFLAEWDAAPSGSLDVARLDGLRLPENAF